VSLSGRCRIATLALLLAAVPCLADTAADLLSVGKKAFSDGAWSLAVLSFQRITIEFPESGPAEEAGYMLGVSQFYAGSPADSLTSLSSFRSHHPRSSLLARSLYWMAAASVRLGRYGDALAFLSDRPESASDPYRYPALLLSGVAREALGRSAEAAVVYRKIAADPGAGNAAAEAAFRCAGIEYRGAHFAAARDLYSKVLIDSPQSPFVRDSVFFLGECSLSLGNLPDAGRRYQTVISLYPDSPYREAALFRSAEVAWRQKQDAAAQDSLDALMREFPAGAYRGSGLRLRADILAADKKYDQAVAGYSAALDALPEGTEKQAAWYSLGMVQLQKGRRAEAAASFGKAGAGAGALTAEKACYQRALLIAGGGQIADAVSALGEFLKAFPSSSRAEEAALLLASLLEKQEDRQAAFVQWDALVKRYPRSASIAEYLFRRGSLSAALGREAAALDDFQRVLKEFPKSARRNESAYSIGYVYAQRGEYPRALPYFQSVTKDPAAGQAGERSMLSAGISLFNMGSFDKALAQLQALRASAPASVGQGTILLYIGRSFYRMEKLSDAEANLGQAATLLQEPQDSQAAGELTDARYWLGWTLMREQKLEEARDSFLAVASIPGEQRAAESFYRAGICETMRHDDVAALALFDNALSGAAAEIGEQALYEKAWALARLGRQQEAAGAFDALARQFPDGRLAPQAFFSLAEKDFESRRYAEARGGFQKVARDFPRSALALRALYLSGESLRLSGDAAGALEDYWSCLSAGAQGALLVSALQGFDTAVRGQGSINVAAAYSDKTEKAENLAPEGAAGIRLAYADMVMGSDPEAALDTIVAVRRAAPPEPFAGEADLLIGRYYAATKDWKRSLDTLGALAGSRADEVGARAALERARTMESMGRTADAVDEFLKVSYLFPEYPDIAAESVYNAARVARVRGDDVRAGKIEQTLRSAYPESPWISRLDGG
jgi:TolA-binding protein